MRWNRRAGREAGNPPSPHQRPRLTPSRGDRSEATSGSFIGISLVPSRITAAPDAFVSG